MTANLKTMRSFLQSHKLFVDLMFDDPEKFSSFVYVGRNLACA